MNLAEIRCIFLDLGKVLVDLDLSLIGAHMQKLSGVPPEKLREAAIGDGLASVFETGRISEAEFHQEVCRRLRKEIGKDDFYTAWNSIFLPDPILPDEVVSNLAKKASLWALSNTNSAHYGFLAGRYSFFRYFAGQILSFEAGLAKPDPRIFKYALDRAGATAAGSLFVDDQAPNVEAARAAGIDAFQFLNPDQFIQEMRSRQLLE